MPLAVEQFGEVAPTFTITGAPPSTAIFADWVFSEMYVARRRCTALLEAEGIAIEMTTLTVVGFPPPTGVAFDDGALGSEDCEPPPHPDKTTQKKIATISRLRISSVNSR
jgi:hypothetical protein